MCTYSYFFLFYLVQFYSQIRIRSRIRIALECRVESSVSYQIPISYIQFKKCAYL